MHSNAPPKDVGLEVESRKPTNRPLQFAKTMKPSWYVEIAKLLAVKYTHMITDSYDDMKWAVLINCQTQIPVETFYSYVFTFLFYVTKVWQLQILSSWWFNQPIWKILVKLGIFPK